MRPAPLQLGLAFGAIIIAAAGFFAGRTLHPDPTPGYAFDADSPAYEATAPHPALTEGGFSGFGETTGLPGLTLLSGRVTSVTAQEVVIEAPDGTKSSVKLANPGAVRRFEEASRTALINGATVVLRHAAGSDEVEAVLIVP
jgi:hypothetical protein